MPSYYDSNPRTSANSKIPLPGEDAVAHFPSEGLYLGDLDGAGIEMPALFDLREIGSLCFLYRSEAERLAVNACLEKLVWRIAMTVPSNLCDLVLFNGGNPGDAFNVHTRINKYLFDDRAERVYFDGTSDAFMSKINDIYFSIVSRMSAIRFAGKGDLVELNESLGKDARFRYEFIFLTDFPRNLRPECLQRISQIVDSGKKAGVYVFMSWDMNADFDEKDVLFNPQTLLSSMELLCPQGGEYKFRGTGHDDVFNRFSFKMDEALTDLFSIEKYLQFIDIQAETARKAAKPSAWKQDFEELEKAPYEPVMSELSITVGRDVNDNRPVEFKLNAEHHIHGFVLGKSGSGKSVLLNNIICSAILKYSPEDLMLYLMDFKGVEFNSYRGIKHTKAVLVDASDPQMTLEVLRELKSEYDRRMELFSEENVKTVHSYNLRHTDKRLSQVLFIADECQEMFKGGSSGDATVSVIQRDINSILDIIATKGRAAGIHMLLATQQLDDVDIPDSVLKNLSECFLLLSAPSDSEKLVPDSSDMTSRQSAGLACYYHEKALQSQVRTFFATEEEIAGAIKAAQKKAENVPGNGEHYFCGSSVYHLENPEKLAFKNYEGISYAYVGKDLKINGCDTRIPLRDDFGENVLIFGANKEEQAIGVLMNTLASLIISGKRGGPLYNIFVIDCLNQQNVAYKGLLQEWSSKGLCRIIPRQKSGGFLYDMVEDVMNGTSRPTMLFIIGQDHFLEVKRKVSLGGSSGADYDDADLGDLSLSIDSIDDLSVDELSVDENAVIPELTEEQKQMLQRMMEDSSSSLSNATQDTEVGPESESETKPATKKKVDSMTFGGALSYLLDEGPIHGVHVILQVDKPTNIFFVDYVDSAETDKFRHKIMLQSENRFVSEMRISQEMDLSSLSKDKKHLRAFYYADGEEPVLFTPYLMPSPDVTEG